MLTRREHFTTQATVVPLPDFWLLILIGEIRIARFTTAAKEKNGLLGWICVLLSACTTAGILRRHRLSMRSCYHIRTNDRAKCGARSTEHAGNTAQAAIDGGHGRRSREQRAVLDISGCQRRR